ncbi:MAG: hypothetical protein HJJLKODD_00777 [Phycisphaerae bacterium]|nr:hypothetical protein [Phycisphaerae bacterium]
MIRSLGIILIESVILLGLAAGSGLMFNVLRSQGLELSRNYFPPVPPFVKTSQPVIPLATQPTSAAASSLSQPALEPSKLSHPFNTLTLQQVYDFYVAGDPTVLFIDARDDEHFADGHILGAVQFNYYHPELYLDKVLAAAATAETIIIYCNGGDCEDSILATEYLTSQITTPLDVNRVYIYEGGISDWRAAGYDLTAPGESEP